MRPKAVPTTELEKKLAAELERQESEYETRLKHLRKKRDEANGRANRAEKEKEVAMTALEAQSAICDRMCAELTASHEKCAKADEELELSRRLITKFTDETKRLERIVEAFRSGSKFENLRRMYAHEVRKLEKTVKDLKSELAQADRALREMRENWCDAFDDMQRELERERADLKRDLAHRDKKKKRPQTGRRSFGKSCASQNLRRNAPKTRPGSWKTRMHVSSAG